MKRTEEEGTGAVGAGVKIAPPPPPAPPRAPRSSDLDRIDQALHSILGELRLIRAALETGGPGGEPAGGSASGRSSSGAGSAG